MQEFRLYIDESGSHFWGPKSTEGDRYLGIAGVIIQVPRYQEITNNLQSIKDKFFGKDPDSPIIFHREAIVSRTGVFAVLEDQEIRRQFNEVLVQFLRNNPFHLITVVIDKKSHFDQYGKRADHPYHFCIKAIVERFCFFLNLRKATGQIFVEPRGKKEDGLLLDAWDDCRNNGTSFVSGQEIRMAIPDGNLNFRSKPYNVTGLQLADMLAYTMTTDVLIEYGVRKQFKFGFDGHIAKAIADKYHRGGRRDAVRGYGKKMLGSPKK